MAAKMDRQRTKFLLDEKDIPTKWYNIQADFKTPAPPVLHPGTKQPIGPADLAPLFPMELIKQEVSQERWIEIPDEVRDILRLWRPTPLYRAVRLEKGESRRWRERHEARLAELVAGLRSLGIEPVLVSRDDREHVFGAFLNWSTERQAAWGHAA